MTDALIMKLIGDRALVVETENDPTKRPPRRFFDKPKVTSSFFRLGVYPRVTGFVKTRASLVLERVLGCPESVRRSGPRAAAMTSPRSALSQSSWVIW